MAPKDRGVDLLDQLGGKGSKEATKRHSYEVPLDIFTRLLIKHYTEIMIMIIIMNLYSAKTIEEYSKSLYIK